MTEAAARVHLRLRGQPDEKSQRTALRATGERSPFKRTMICEAPSAPGLGCSIARLN